ncbi:MAG: hypothetical protein JSV89_11180 [Spirochaetaceae bacterium]|nr:MAG: hypothetical protein JSV89_11180 [Spirochaetaceae bacterium]
MSTQRSILLLIFTALFLILLPASTPLYCQSVETLAIGFSRTTISADGEEQIQGILYFQAPEDVLIKVKSPVLQWTVFEGTDLLIYYPREGKAFRFISRNRLMIPFAQSFIGLVRDDFGLSDAGFILTENRKRADILITVWSAPRALRSYIGEAHIGTQKGIREVHPLYLEIYDPRGKMLTRVTYLDYLEDLEPSFPARILIQQKNGEKEIREEIRYFDHRINESLPREVTDFELPADVSVEELKW